MQESIEPLIGDTPESYRERILDTLNQLRDEQLGASQQAVTGGFAVPAQTNPSAFSSAQPSAGQGNIPTAVYKGKTFTPSSQSMAQNSVWPEFGSKQEMNDWFLKQTPQIQSAYATYLKGKS
jgi:hypothetical protein